MVFLQLLFLDLQNVNITLRILFRPKASKLPQIYTNLGIDYDDRVLPSIVNEVLKSVVVRNIQYSCLTDNKYLISYVKPIDPGTKMLPGGQNALFSKLLLLHTCNLN